jgi:acyl-CoA reductase-like NAD-dependent aldehyde dehydrogenase
MPEATEPPIRRIEVNLHTMRVAREEVFGPVATVIRAKNSFA